MGDSRDLFGAFWRSGLHDPFQYTHDSDADGMFCHTAQSHCWALQIHLSFKRSSNRAVTERVR